MLIRDKVCIVTGASSGIGRALAVELAKQNNRVTVLARRKEALDELEKEIVGSGGQVLTVCSDISEPDTIETAIQQTVDRWGRLDLVIANAAINDKTPPHEMSWETLNDIVTTNYTAAMWTLAAASKVMFKQGSGQLVGIASIAGFRGMPRAAIYSSTKAGFRSFLESMRITCKSRGVSVTSICPGFVRTPMIEGGKYPQPFRLEPEQAAQMILRAIARRRSEYIFPWKIALVIRLTRLLPNFIYDRLLQRYDDSKK